MTQFPSNDFQNYNQPSTLPPSSPAIFNAAPSPKPKKSRANLIIIICLSVLSVAMITLAIWSFINYNNEKNTVDAQVNAAVASAKKAQADSDEKKYDELKKLPYLQFTGPDDYGRVTFNYPKTWSQYISDDATNGGVFKAYLNPVSVPSVARDNTQFALRVTIEQKSYDSSVNIYSARVKSGKLSSSVVTADGVTGTRLDGSFTEDIRGIAVIFKIRDKTLTVRTDADTFKNDFEALIKTIKFNQ